MRIEYESLNRPEIRILSLLGYLSLNYIIALTVKYLIPYFRLMLLE